MREAYLVQEIAATTRNAIVGGPFGSNLVSADYVDSGVPVIRGQNMGSRWISGEFVFVSQSKAESLSQNVARPGDLVFTQRGTLGQVAIVPCGEFNEYILSQSQMKVSPDPAVADVLYLYYLFSSPEQQSYIHSNAIQAGVPHTNLGILKKTPVVLPSMREQKRVAQILGFLDDKIELNRRVNETLKQIARAIFRAWFIDFLPVRAKITARAEGRDPLRAAMCGLSGKDEAALNAMTSEQYEQLAATAALIPDELVDSELGEVPLGWGIEPLVQLLDVLETGRRPKGGVGAYSEGIPSVGAENILSVGNYDYRKTKYIPVEFFERMKSGVIEPYDVLLYKDGGKPGDFKPRVSLFGEGFPFEKFVINEHVFRMRSAEIGQAFLYFQLSSERVLFELAHRGAKAAIPGINQRDVNSLQFLAPPQAVTARFDEMVGGILASVLVRAKESQTLAVIRDTLLPKLLSGKIRVGEAQKLVEAAA